MEILPVLIIGFLFLLVAFLISGLFFIKVRKEVVVIFLGKYSKLSKLLKSTGLPS